MSQAGEKMFNLGAFKFHIQQRIELLYKERRNTKNPYTMACYDEQISLLEKVQRAYVVITDEELGEITKEEALKQLDVIYNG